MTAQVPGDVDASLGEGPRPAVRKRIFPDSFASCRNAEKRAMAPFPSTSEEQCGIKCFNSHRCLRQLALIECPGTAFKDLPLDYAALLEHIDERRNQETCAHVLWSEIRQAAFDAS